MLFMACLMSYMMRVNLSINIIAMVENTDANSTEVLPDVSKISFFRTFLDFVFVIFLIIDEILIYIFHKRIAMFIRSVVKYVCLYRLLTRNTCTHYKLII